MSKLKKKIKHRYEKFFHRPPPGSSPGTVIAPVDPSPTKVVLTAYNAEQLEHRALTKLSDLPQQLNSFEVTWISVIGMQNTGIIQELCQRTGIHRLTIEDILNQYQRPKVEYFDHYTYISVHAPLQDGQSESEVISILMGKNFIISIQDSSVDYLDAIRERILKKIGQIRNKTSDYLCYAIIDAVIDLYFPLSEYYAQKLELAESDIIQGLKPVGLFEVYTMRSRLNFFHRILWSHNQMISQLIHDPESQFDDSCTVYLRDCFDHTMQILEFLDNLKENAKTLIDLHLSLQNHRSNEVVKFLTIITATFIPMTFITGLYGMNFNRELPGNMPELDWAYGYPFALFMMLMAAGSMLFFFYRQNWLTGRAVQKLPRGDDL